MADAHRTAIHEIISPKKLRFAIHKLIEKLVEDEIAPTGAKIQFNKDSLRELPLLFPNIFHKACYYLDLKALHVVVYSRERTDDLYPDRSAVLKDLDKFDHLMYIRDKELNKTRNTDSQQRQARAKDKTPFVVALDEQFDDSAILRNYKDTTTVNIVDLGNWTCQCANFIIQLVNAHRISEDGTAVADTLGVRDKDHRFDLSPMPVCEHLLCCYIWSMHRQKLADYVDLKVVTEFAEWLDENDKVTNANLV